LVKELMIQKSSSVPSSTVLSIGTSPVVSLPFQRSRAPTRRLQEQPRSKMPSMLLSKLLLNPLTPDWERSRRPWRRLLAQWLLPTT